MTIKLETLAIKLVVNLFTSWLENKEKNPDTFKYYVTYLEDTENLYEVLGYSTGAGTSKGNKLVVYQSLKTKEIYHRTFEDFCNRMVPYNGN